MHKEIIIKQVVQTKSNSIHTGSQDGIEKEVSSFNVNVYSTSPFSFRSIHHTLEIYTETNGNCKYVMYITCHVKVLSLFKVINSVTLVYLINRGNNQYNLEISYSTKGEAYWHPTEYSML